MNEIHILDNNTIDQIAAGEVVERPSSIVKELVENAIDAGATHITVEIKDGGIKMVRVTDDGSGIDKSQLSKVFLRHATSKIKEIEDLDTVMSLGFRGEALSSISAVCQVELITKTRDQLTGTRVCINGGEMEQPEEIGAPDGTTIIARNIFFNTPVRKKFLKTAQTEGSYIADLMQHIALSSPQIAIQFISNGSTKFYTSGNGNIKEIIYRIYGKDVADHIMPFENTMEGVKVSGFLGKPVLNRSNRGFETFFVNHRYIKNGQISLAVEEGYKTFLMQHKYPFVVLYFDIDPTKIDVNVHPTKMDIRINEPMQFLAFIRDTVKDNLSGKPFISPMDIAPYEKTKQQVAQEKELTAQVPQPFEKKRMLSESSRYMAEPANPIMPESKPEQAKSISVSAQPELAQTTLKGVMPEPELAQTPVQVTSKQILVQETPEQTPVQTTVQCAPAQTPVPSAPEQTPVQSSEQSAPAQTPVQVAPEQASASAPRENKILGNLLQNAHIRSTQAHGTGNVIKQKDTVIIEKAEQLSLFEDEDIRKQPFEDFKILGQVFDTYWIVSTPSKLYYIDQHAAHEKVMYEKLMQHYREKQVMKQELNPPLAVTVTIKEKAVIKKHVDVFESLGFELDDFGDNVYALRTVPMDLYGMTETEQFLMILDELVEFPVHGDNEGILAKIASMSCKAAVKGNMALSMKEAEALLKDLFACENPYNCPHGRPTIISMTKYELEKKFKRLV